MSRRKRVGVITFHESLNYGAILQTFALQRFLADQGYEAEVIDYRNPNRWKAQVHGFHRLRSLVWRSTLGRILGSRKRQRRTELFLKRYVRFSTSRFVGYESILSSPPSYDCYIVGSDQVWNPRNNMWDPAYFLSFAPDDSVKIAYAASFGVSALPASYMDFCAPLIGRLDHISVREKSGVTLVREMTGTDAVVCVDPVFLLDTRVWNQVATPSVENKEDYILCYYMPGDKLLDSAMRSLAEQLASMTGLRVVSVGKKVYERWKWWENSDYDAGPAEFVGLIRGARFVITTSFHGTAFSIIYNRPFWVPIREDLPKDIALSERITALLDTLGLQSRLWRIGSQPRLNEADLDIDYRPAARILSVEVERSKRFILEALGD